MIGRGMDEWCRTQAEVLGELDRRAPDAPFLALGQTIFWDEPMKAGVILSARKAGSNRPFIAGVHDTDYFAKSPIKEKRGGFKALPHNDTTTKGLWSAAGEFSTLFGSETVITREQMQKAGAKVGRIASERPGELDQYTEAYGWRGIVSFDPEQKITAEEPLGPMFPALHDTFVWAVEESLSHLAGPHHSDSRRMADRIRATFCDEWDRDCEVTLGEFYERLLPKMYDLAGGEHVDLETTRTTQLLKFNRETCQRPRFELVDLFLRPETRALAEKAYNDSVSRSDIYSLDRFGTGALPFDLYIPGIGRGTLRLGNRGGVVMAPTPVGFSFKKPITSVCDLADVLEKRFGRDCVLIGKAVSLIGMLAREFVFVFHEGASGYVWRSRAMHQALEKSGHRLEVNPILRVTYEPWDALAECCAWFKLPEPLKRPFGVEELSASTFALRWRPVAQKQKERLERLGELRRPKDFIEWLQTEIGGHWTCLANAYESLHQSFNQMNESLEEIRARKAPILEEMSHLKQERVQAEIESGQHWRDHCFEKSPDAAVLSERDKLQGHIEQIIERQDVLRAQWRDLQKEQDDLVGSTETNRLRERRQTIALEAELMRMKLIREAVIASEGLAKAGHRPAAWWMPLVCPDGTWFQATMRRAKFCLEELN